MMDARDAQEQKLRRKYRMASKDRAKDKAMAISRRILAMPAATMADVMVKLRMGRRRSDPPLALALAMADPHSCHGSSTYVRRASRPAAAVTTLD